MVLPCIHAFPSLPPSLNSGPEYKWLDWYPLVQMLNQTWPAVRKYMPKISKWEDEDGKSLLPAEEASTMDHNFPKARGQRVGHVIRLCVKTCARPD